MARSAVADLVSPHPVVRTLPGLYQDDDFLRRFLAAVDDVLAPIFSVLDGGLEAHLDPALVPEDFIPWLGSWLGLAMEESWPEARRRDLIANAVELYRWRGTVRGLVDAVSLFTDEVPEILESGGVAFSTTPGADMPGVPTPQIVVRIRLESGDNDALARIDRIVALAKPAHLVHRVEAV